MKKHAKKLIKQDWMERRLSRKSLCTYYWRKYYYKNNEDGD